MSKLKVSALQGLSASSDAITLANDGTCTANITNNLSNRSKVINGSMIVSQRGTSFASTLTEGQYTVDRFNHSIRGTNDSYYYQVSDAPEGFSKSLKVTCNSTYTPSGSDNAGFMTSLEGQDLQDLKFGTSNAKKSTVSFYAKTGSQNNGHQYSFQIRSSPSGGATVRTVTFPFTVTSSWQRFTFEVPADTGADILDSTAAGFQCAWWLDAGPTDIISQITTWTASASYRAVTGQDHFLNNTSNEFYLTGVQLEVGSVATDFEHRSYAQELALCQRYFYQYVDGSEYSSGTSSLCNVIGYQNNNAFGTLQFPVTMRAKPTLVHAEGTSYFKIYRNAGSGDLNSMTLQASGKNGANINVYNASSGTSIAQDQGGFMLSNDTGVRVGFSAEL